MQKLRPIHDRVVIRRHNPEQRSKGGIILPERAQEQSLTGEVLAVGPGSFLPSGDRCAMSVREGETVLVSRFRGETITIDGEELLIVEESDIAGVIDRY